MSLNNIVEDSFGTTIALTVVQDTVAQDISSYTAIAFIFRSPSGVSTSKVGAFTTDGTDGVVEYTLIAGDIDVEGVWRVQVLLTKAGVSVSTVRKAFTVLPRLEV